MNIHISVMQQVYTMCPKLVPVVRYFGVTIRNQSLNVGKMEMSTNLFNIFICCT